MRKILRIVVFSLLFFFLPGIVTHALAVTAKVEPSVASITEYPKFISEGCDPATDVTFKWAPFSEPTNTGLPITIKADASGRAVYENSSSFPPDTYRLFAQCSKGNATTVFAVKGNNNAEILGMSADGDGDGTPEKNEDITVVAGGCPSGSVGEFVWDYENGVGSPNRTGQVSEDPPGKWKYTTKYNGNNVFIQIFCKKNGAVVDKSAVFQLVLQDNPDNPDGDGPPTLYPTQPPPPPPICAKFDSKGKCTEVNTAIGNICTETNCFVESLFILILSMSGGIAVLIIMYAGYVYMTSRGNPERLQRARDWLVSALVGFLFIIFSLVIMETITTDVLKLPGFIP